MSFSTRENPPDDRDADSSDSLTPDSLVTPLARGRGVSSWADRCPAVAALIFPRVAALIFPRVAALEGRWLVAGDARLHG